MQPSITHQKGACSSAHRSAVIRGEPDISPHREIKACPPSASHPLLPLLTHRLWCSGLCVWCGTMLEHVALWGRASPCPWTMVALEVPQRLGKAAGCRPPLTHCCLLFSHSLVALITLHVPCLFTLATKGREVKVRPSTGVLRSAYYGSVFWPPDSVIMLRKSHLSILKSCELQLFQSVILSTN